MPLIQRVLAGPLALIAALLCPAAPADAQQQPPRVGVGYVANAPHQFLGLSVHGLSTRWGGIGLYMDAKFDTDSPREEENFRAELTAREVEDQIGDQLFQQETSWQSFNAALLRPLTPELTLYLGAGHGRREVYREYFDPSGAGGALTHYWVEDTEQEGTFVNVLGGALFRIGTRILVQFGAESAPRGITVGAAYAIPLR